VAAIPTDYKSEREAMVDRQLRSRGISSRHILDAFGEVPREAFVSAEYASLAYGDHPLPIEAGQTISQPYIVALMIEAAAIKGGDRVLEIGTGSGYAAAVISRIASKVVGIERQHELVEIARSRLRRLGYDNVEVFEGDGTRGWLGDAPYDAILAAASGTHIPHFLVDQLKEGASIVMPLGSPSEGQTLVKATRRADGSLEQLDLGAVRFVPLIGEEGWNDARE
jgi:protein-L-isoaspartate(D-aspartate) O-methyltransferase